MPAMTPAEIRGVFDDAVAFEFARRERETPLFLGHTPAVMRAAEQVGLEAVARAQLMVAAPATNTHPLFRRLTRQARQLDHVSKTLTIDDADKRDLTEALVNAMWSTTVMLAELGVQPAEKWQTFAETIIESNTALVARIVAAGRGKLPPAERDTDDPPST